MSDHLVPLVGLLVTVGLFCSVATLLGGAPLLVGALGVLLTGIGATIAVASLRGGGRR